MTKYRIYASFDIEAEDIEEVGNMDDIINKVENASKDDILSGWEYEKLS